MNRFFEGSSHKAAKAAVSARFCLLAAILLAMALRAAAYLILSPDPPQSDGLAYLTMAANLAERGVLIDNFGQHVFFSAGYPLLLAPFFAIFGSSVETAILANILLAGVNCWLIWALARELGAGGWVAVLAALAFALWIPGIWNAAFVAKENLSTPLLTVLLILAARLAKGGIGDATAIVAGLVYAANLITGGSALPVAAAVALAIIIGQWSSLGRALRRLLLFAAAALALLVPWLAVTDSMVGAPVLTTNSGFNLYLGNNPAATGRFVSIAETPAGPRWESMRTDLGEVEASAALGEEARSWMTDNPLEALRLSAIKLGLFWAPNIPDAADLEWSSTIATLRWAEVAQYTLILVFGLGGLVWAPMMRRHKLVLLTAIAGFWLLHGAIYIIPRYRDPVMPVLIVLAVIQAVALVGYFRSRRSQSAPSRSARPHSDT